MEMDLEILVEQAHRIGAHTQWGKDFDVAALADEFAAVLRSELDYTHEGRALDRFRAAFEDDARRRLPGGLLGPHLEPRAHHGLRGRDARDRARGRAAWRASTASASSSSASPPTSA